MDEYNWTVISEASHYLSFAAAFCRGRLGRREGDDLAAIAAGADAGLRLHRFKRTAGLPRVRRVIGVLRGLAPPSLLDVGTGRGAFLWPLLDAMPDVRVIAVDRLAGRVADLAAVARGGLGRRLTPMRMDATRLALRDAAVDVVTVLEVLEHLREPEAAAREALRAAARALVVTVPSREDDNPEHRHLLERRRLERMLRDGGARRVAVEQVRGHLVAVALK